MIFFLYDETDTCIQILETSSWTATFQEPPCQYPYILKAGGGVEFSLPMYLTEKGYEKINMAMRDRYPVIRIFYFLKTHTIKIERGRGEL